MEVGVIFKNNDKLRIWIVIFRDFNLKVEGDCSSKSFNWLLYYFNIVFEAMEQPDHMIDIVIIFYVNFYPYKIRYQVKNL